MEITKSKLINLYHKNTGDDLAKILGVSRSHIYKVLKQYGIPPKGSIPKLKVIED